MGQGWSEESNENYAQLKASICNLYPEGLPNHEADQATRNFIGFGKLLLEIKYAQMLESEDE